MVLIGVRVFSRGEFSYDPLQAGRMGVEPLVKGGGCSEGGGWVYTQGLQTFVCPSPVGARPVGDGTGRIIPIGVERYLYWYVVRSC